MITNLKAYNSDSLTPEKNLAIEEYLFSNVEKNELIVFFWQNDNTVVIGKNQNLYRECNLENIKQGGGRIVRRSTGGGAVYHDVGNLNFSFITQKENYDKREFFDIIVSALFSLGIKTEVSGRNDILLDGKKFSGNAFLYRENRVLHHGTIMLTVNFEKLNSYLKIPVKNANLSVASVPSRVINLKAVKPELTIVQLKNAILDSLGAKFNSNAEILNAESLIIPDLNKRSKVFTAFDSVKFIKNAKEHKFPWGTVVLHKDCGRHKGAVLFSDSLEPDVIDYVNSELLKNAEEISENPYFDRTKNEMLKDISLFLRGEI